MSGLLIVMEGIDGSGKATHSSALSHWLTDQGLRTSSFSFPGYGKTPFSDAILQYLHGDFGPIDRIPVKLISLLFACDRMSARDELLKAMEVVDVVICDRYVASNLAHQGAKAQKDDLESLIAWILEVEYQTFKMPRPDLTILIDTPVREARHRIASRANRPHTSVQEDYHEKDTPYLERCSAIYRQLAHESTGGRWLTVGATAAPVSKVQHEIRAGVSQLLLSAGRTTSL